MTEEAWQRDIYRASIPLNDPKLFHQLDDYCSSKAVYRELRISDKVVRHERLDRKSTATGVRNFVGIALALGRGNFSD